MNGFWWTFILESEVHIGAALYKLYIQFNLFLIFLQSVLCINKSPHSQINICKMRMGLFVCYNLFSLPSQDTLQMRKWDIYVEDWGKKMVTPLHSFFARIILANIYWKFRMYSLGCFQSQVKEKLTMV